MAQRMYPRMFWETGVIGQTLYLEAEAGRLRTTDIGCFHDGERSSDPRDQGPRTGRASTTSRIRNGAVEDQRLQSLDAYGHLFDDRRTTAATGRVK